MLLAMKFDGLFPLSFSALSVVARSIDCSDEGSGGGKVMGSGLISSSALEQPSACGAN
jgi:hypothetical protein